MATLITNGLDGFKKDYPQAEALFAADKLSKPIKEIKVLQITELSV